MNFEVGQKVKASEKLRGSSFSILPGFIGTVMRVHDNNSDNVYYNVDFTGNISPTGVDVGRNWVMLPSELEFAEPPYMEKIELVREKFKEAARIYATSKDSTAHYYEGKMVGMVEGIASLLEITWIEADVLLRKEI